LLRGGDSFEVGNIRFDVVHTPGHTPEHVAFLVTDLGAGATEPMGMISGDFLFVGDLGRPDLLETAAGEAGAMEPAARRLFESVRALDALPPFVQVWPGHGAGSACGKALGGVPTSTIGYEKRFNPAIRAAESADAFTDFILAGQPEPPIYFRNMKRDNRAGPRVLGALPAPPRLSAEDMRRLDGRRVAIIDTRRWEAFRRGHIAGSLYIPLGNSFCTDAGSLVDEGEDICLVLEEGERDEAVRLLVRIGLDRIVGWFDASEIASCAGDAGLATIAERSAGEVGAALDAGRVRVLDVRRASEFAEGHIPGATNIAHTRLAARLGEVPAGPLVINCRSGGRSARAASFLARRGHEVINLEGGYLGWERTHPHQA
jgi:hydroxyacylglutathione hydrolase